MITNIPLRFFLIFFSLLTWTTLGAETAFRSDLAHVVAIRDPATGGIVYVPADDYPDLSQFKGNAWVLSPAQIEDMRRKIESTRPAAETHEFALPSVKSLDETREITRRGLGGDFTVSPHALAASRTAQEISSRAPAQTFVVALADDLPDTDPNDDVYDPPTLRSAVQNANKTAALDQITFAVASVAVNNPIGAIVATQPVIMDGALSGGGKVVANGLGTTTAGLWFQGGGSTIKNLEITGMNGGACIVLGGIFNEHNQNVVQGCVIHDNVAAGILFNRSSNNVIGGLSAIERNTVYNQTGNYSGALNMFLSSHNNLVIGNYIGTPDGLTPGTNARSGIFDEGIHNYIGFNVISGNAWYGVNRDDNFDSLTAGQVVEFNKIGVTADGLAKLGNGTGTFSNDGYYSGRFGVNLAEDTIRNNIVSANGGNGINTTCPNAVIESNIVGLDINRELDFGNKSTGVVANKQCLIQNNVVSGNDGRGIAIGGADPIWVRNNIVGADAAARATFGNSGVGIDVRAIGATVGGSSVLDANIICKNGGDGIWVLGRIQRRNRIQFNYVGVDQTGSIALPNGGHGINLFGACDSNIVAYNSVASNSKHGIIIAGISTGADPEFAEGNIVHNNFVGFAANNTALPNLWYGILIEKGKGNQIGGSADSGNVIVAQDSSSVFLRISESNRIIGNTIGTNSDLTLPQPQAGLHGICLDSSSYNNIGGSAAEHGNTIVGYDSTGITIVSGGQNNICGNIIGNASVPAKRAAGQDFGIVLRRSAENFIGGYSLDSVNIIGNNSCAGIALYDTLSFENVMLGNFIGVDKDSTTALPNGCGILVFDGRFNDIGNQQNHGNLIKSNSGPGVLVQGDNAYVNTIRFNSIYGNDGLDIDLGQMGVTPNDLGDMVNGIDDDDGPNDLLNFPVGVTYSFDKTSLMTIITGFYDTYDPEGDTIDIYATPAVNDSGHGGGKVYIGSTVPDTNGFWRYEFNGTVADLPYIFISATATDIDGSTSEFSPVCGDPNGFGNVDNDGDGLCDDWEMNGIDYDGDGIIDLPLQSPPFVANNRVKDIFVEIDWMYDPTFSSKPGNLIGVDVAFSHSPVDNPHSSLDGIELHTILSDSMPLKEWVGFNTDPPDPAAPVLFPDFQEIKWGNPYNPCSNSPDGPFFGDESDRASANCAAILGAKRLAYHYCIFGYYHGHMAGSSGVADYPGDDFMVTLGDWSGDAFFVSAGNPVINQGSPLYEPYLNIARSEVQSATFMHELGHTLGLDHGGGDRINNKPHYYSIMSYSRQMAEKVPGRKLDYSRADYGVLDESSLQETAGIPGPTGDYTVFLQNRGPATDTIVSWSAGTNAVDWDGLDSDLDGDFDNDPNVSANINRLDPSDASTAGLQQLQGHDDWSNLIYHFRSAGDYALGTSHADSGQYFTDEMSLEFAAAVDFDNDGFSNLVDNCPADYNPDQADTNSNGVGDICEAVDQYLCGDVDGSDDVNVSDVVFLVNYIFNDGPPPPNFDAADADCDNDILVTDCVYLIQYIFNDGPPPCAACP